MKINRSVDVTHVTTEKVWRWRTYSIMVGALIICGLLGWQLLTLNPRQWCQTTYDFAKATNVQNVLDELKTCVVLQMKILSIKDHGILGLLGALIMVILLLMISEFGYNADVKGPGGVALGFQKKAEDNPPQKIEGEVKLSPTEDSSPSGG